MIKSIPNRSVLKSWFRHLSPLLVLLSLLLSQDLLAVTPVTQIKLPQGKIQDAFRPRRLFLLIGVSQFKDRKFHSLKYPNKDVQDLKRFLATHNNFPGDEYLVLENDAVTPEAVVKALDQIEQKNTSEDDTVAIYFSTHGTLAYERGHRLQRYAVLGNTDFDRIAETALSIDYVQSRLTRLKSTKKALVLALCHSGSGKSQLPKAISEEMLSLKAGTLPPPLHEVSSAMMVLSASSWGQPAREDDKLQNDIYTHFLIKGLSSYDANGDGAVSLFEAHEFARSQTYDYTRGAQTPSALVNLEGTDPIILQGTVKRQPVPVIYADHEQFRNLELYVNGKSKGTLWQPQKLEPGRVRLTLVDPQTPETPLVDHQMFLQQNKPYSVSQILARQPSYSAEVHAFGLPLPSALDDLTAEQTIAPGVVVRASDMMGTPVQVGLGYFQRKTTGETAQGDITSPVTLTSNLWRVFAGYALFPRANMSVSFNANVDYLSIDRTIANRYFAKPNQSLAVAYPAASAEFRLLNLVGSWQVGAALYAIPPSVATIKINEESIALRAWSASVSSGVSF